MSEQTDGSVWDRHKSNPFFWLGLVILALFQVLVFTTAIKASCPCDCELPPPAIVCYHTPDMFQCRDGVVGIDEFLYVLANWGPCDDYICLCLDPEPGNTDWGECSCCEWGDIDRNGWIDIPDLIEVLNAWGPFDELAWHETRCRDGKLP